MRNDVIIKSIECLLAGYKKEMALQNPNKKDLWFLRYLLGQSIRQYDIPGQNHHLSQAAHNR